MIKNPLNVNSYSKTYKYFTQPSQTVPDQTMSIKTILERYAQGLPIDAEKNPIYEDEETNGINPRTLDLVDIQEMHMDNTDKIEYLKTKLKADKAPKQPKNNEETEKP